MKHWKQRLTALAMCLATGFGFCCGDGIHTAQAAKTGDDWLHVEGNKICDVNGIEVWLTGCNWFGYNVGSQVFDGVWSQNMHSMIQQIADHGFNFLRVPMSTEILLQWKNGDPDPAPPKINTYKNPELSVDGVEGGATMYSFDVWNKAVEWCEEAGIKIMIDIHSAETASAGHQIHLWYTDKFSTEDWMTALEWFAGYYKDNDTILAIDLKNEPHGTADEPAIMAKWDGSEDPTNWAYAASECGKRVLDVNPNLLIMVEGVEVYPKFEEDADWTSQNTDYARYPYSYYHHTWWGGNFRGARDFPVDFGSAAYNKQLVYSPHDYGPLVWEQTWFEGDFTQESLMKDCWYDNWAYLYEENIAPLLIGEWGGFIDAEHDADGKNVEWMTYLRDYMIEKHIHHTFWCFNENSGDTGGLVYDNFGIWDEEKYALVKPALWQSEGGAFIGLDHEIPLGVNGVTVAEYYGGTPSTKPPVTTTTTDKAAETTTASKATTATTVTTTDTQASVLLGDVNKDGVISIADVVMLARYVSQDDELDMTLLAKQNTDYNGDAEINATDVSELSRALAGL